MKAAKWLHWGSAPVSFLILCAEVRGEARGAGTHCAKPLGSWQRPAGAPSLTSWTFLWDLASSRAI